MKALALSLAVLFLFPADADAQALNRFVWKSRVVMLFTPEPGDPLFGRQVQLLDEYIEELRERDVTVMFITPNGKYENTGRFAQQSEARMLYEQFSVAQYQFEMILLGYDGHEKFRAKNRITPPSVLLNLIDGMPMRQRELRQGYGNKSMINDDNRNQPVVKKRRGF